MVVESTSYQGGPVEPLRVLSTILMIMHNKCISAPIPEQPGPIYFKTLRKCGLFAICCEGIPRQVNYLIDKAVNVGKGANSTISYVHDFFTSHGVRETDTQINADNCGWQNKNNFVICTILSCIPF